MKASTLSLLLLLWFLCRDAGGQTINGQRKQEVLMNTILGSIDDLRSMAWDGERHSSLDIQLANRMDRLQAQMTTLSAELATLNSQFSGATASTLRLMNNLARATKTNSRSISSLWGRINQLEVETDRRRKTSSGRDCPNPPKQTPDDSVKEVKEEEKSPVSDRLINNDTDQELRVPSIKHVEELEQRGSTPATQKAISDEETVPYTSLYYTTESRDPSTSLEREGETPNTSPAPNVNNSNLNKTPTLVKQQKSDVKKAMILRAIAKISKDNEASTAAILSIARRVVALEKYTSPEDGAVVNVSRTIGVRVDNLFAIVSKLARDQGEFNNQMALRVGSIETFAERFSDESNNKQQRFVVDTSSTMVFHKYLDTDIRIRFKKVFSSPPEVFAAISGFAMDPDYASLKQERNESQIQDLLNSHIYAVQTNFYTVRVEAITNIDTSGFSIKVHDGRKMLYSAFQWVQIQWIAVGK